MKCPGGWGTRVRQGVTDAIVIIIIYLHHLCCAIALKFEEEENIKSDKMSCGDSSGTEPLHQTNSMEK